jgi:NAD(P)-dependent dehydrogenase (short-subunit alcohol dehydrogenase family)
LNCRIEQESKQFFFEKRTKKLLLLRSGTLTRKGPSSFGGLHLACNNAGQLRDFLPLHEAAMGNFDTVIVTNLRGVYACLKFEIVAMLQAGTPGAIARRNRQHLVLDSAWRDAWGCHLCRQQNRAGRASPHGRRRGRASRDPDQ